MKNQESTAVNNAGGIYAKISLNQTDLEDISQGMSLNEHLHIQILRL